MERSRETCCKAGSFRVPHRRRGSEHQTGQAVPEILKPTVLGGGSSAAWGDGGWMGWGCYVMCPAQAASCIESGSGTMLGPPAIHHVSLPAMPPQVGSFLPSHLGISEDISPASTDCLHLVPLPLLLISLKPWPCFRAAQPTCIKNELYMSLRATTMSQSRVLLLSCMLHDTVQRGQPQQGLLSLSVLEVDRRRSGG